MPRYFFHFLHPDREPISDKEGLVFEDNATARREGLVSLCEFMTESTKAKPAPLSVSVQIDREGVGVIEILTGDLSVLPRP